MTNKYQIDFTKGHWRHSKKQAQLISAGGEVITRSVAAVPPARSMGVGDSFARKHQELFKGCGCKREVVQIMNRWARKKTTELAIETVAKTIANKNADVEVEHVLNLIGLHLQSIVDEATKA
jgi:hypothetical protein